MPTEY